MAQRVQASEPDPLPDPDDAPVAVRTDDTPIDADHPVVIGASTAAPTLWQWTAMQNPTAARGWPTAYSTVARGDLLWVRVTDGVHVASITGAARRVEQ